MWLQHSKRKFLRELFDGLGTILGTKMDATRLYGSSDKKGNASKRLVSEADVPLAFLLGTQAHAMFESILKKPSKDNEFGQFTGDELQRLFQMSLQKQAQSVIDDIRGLHQDSSNSGSAEQE